VRSETKGMQEARRVPGWNGRSLKRGMAKEMKKSEKERQQTGTTK
jgi:hypothetical protein